MRYLIYLLRVWDHNNVGNFESPTVGSRRACICCKRKSTKSMGLDYGGDVYNV